MHLDVVVKNLNLFRDKIALDVCILKKISYIYRVIDVLLKLPMMITSASTVLIASLNTVYVEQPLNITILCLNSLLACLTAIYMYITPSVRADKADICVAQLEELSNDVNISISELTVDGILTEYDSENSSSGDREMYQRYLVMITRFSMKKMQIDNTAPIGIHFLAKREVAHPF